MRPIEAQHSKQLVLRSPLARGTAHSTINQAFAPFLDVPVPPTPKRPLANPKKLSRLNLAQIPTLMPIQQRLKTHQTDLLKHRCPSHPRLQNGGSKTGHITRYKNRTNDELVHGVSRMVQAVV